MHSADLKKMSLKNVPPAPSGFRKSGHPRKSNGPVPGENGITPVLAPPLAFVPA